MNPTNYVTFGPFLNLFYFIYAQNGSQEKHTLNNIHLNNIHLYNIHLHNVHYILVRYKIVPYLQ